MKDYKISINGNEYNVAILNVKDSVAKVTVNGVEYEAKIDGLSKKEKEAPVVRRPVVQQTVPTPRAAAPAANGIKSPLPGVILDVCVKEGDSVKAGQKLMVLEAMKMENSIEADVDGVVKSIKVRVNDSVLEGDLLISIE